MDPRQAYQETTGMLFLSALGPNRNRLMCFKYPLWYILYQLCQSLGDK